MKYMILNLSGNLIWMCETLEEAREYIKKVRPKNSEKSYVIWYKEDGVCSEVKHA